MGRSFVKCRTKTVAIFDGGEGRSLDPIKWSRLDKILDLHGLVLRVNGSGSVRAWAPPCGTEVKHNYNVRFGHL